MSIVSAATWEQYLKQHPTANLLQARQWGELKQEFGWQVERVCYQEAGAQVLFRRLPLGFSFAYVPKGPVGPQRDWPGLLSELDQVCRRKRAVILKVEPDLWQPHDAEDTPALFRGFVESDAIQPRRTVMVSLAGSEEAWLERMKQKTRYNIRLAERKEVQVEPSQDLDGFYELMKVTGGRDGFGIHEKRYYQRAYALFHPIGQCELLVAKYAGNLLAGLMVFACGKRAWYLYGASNDEERNRMPTYLLQWEAMRWAAQRGCESYDMVGVPDEDEQVLEAKFAERSDGLWGVYRFKRGFGGQVLRSVGAWDRAYFPFAVQLYRWWKGRRSGVE